MLGYRLSILWAEPGREEAPATRAGAGASLPMWVTPPRVTFSRLHLPGGTAGRHDGAVTTAVVRAGTTKLGYRPELDGLRAFAVVAVILDHTGLPGFEGGGIGVDVFFALSGFLITALLLEEWRSGGVSLLGFWRRRALRLVPCLLAVVGACWLLLPWLPADTAEGFGPALLYHANWHRAFDGDIGALGHTWSLAIEEQFYVVWPLVLLALLRLGGARLALRFCLVGAVGVALVRELVAGPLGTDRVYNGADLRADGLLWGCALAVALHLGWRLHRGAGVAVTVLAAVWALRGVVVLPWAERSVAAVATCVLIAAVTPRMRTIFSHPALTWTGRRAYGLYLWHYVLARLLLDQDQSVQQVTVMLMATFVIAAASYRWIEAPFLVRKSRSLVGDSPGDHITGGQGEGGVGADLYVSDHGITEEPDVTARRDDVRGEGAVAAVRV